jgi:hypothetical protein
MVRGCENADRFERTLRMGKLNERFVTSKLIKVQEIDDHLKIDLNFPISIAVQSSYQPLSCTFIGYLVK